MLFCFSVMSVSMFSLSCFNVCFIRTLEIYQNNSLHHIVACILWWEKNFPDEGNFWSSWDWQCSLGLFNLVCHLSSKVCCSQMNNKTLRWGEGKGGGRGRDAWAKCFLLMLQTSQQWDLFPLIVYVSLLAFILKCLCGLWFG